MEKKQRAKKAQASAHPSDCDGFLDCMVRNPGAGVQTASIGRPQ